MPDLICEKCGKRSNSLYWHEKKWICSKCYFRPKESESEESKRRLPLKILPERLK